MRLKRVLLVNYEYPPLGGGAGNATAHIAQEMARQGVQALVLTSAFDGLAASEERDGYAIRRIPTVRRFAEKCAAWEMAAFMASSLLHAPLAARAFRPDATLAFFGIPCGPAAWLLKLLRGTPYCVSLRGGDVPGFQPYDLARMHRLTGPAIRFLWRRAGAVVPNSQGLAALAKAFEPGLDYPVVPNGADAELFRPRTGPRAPGPARLFFHGRLVYQKGLDVLLDALALLPPDAAWELHLAGDGPFRPELEARAGALGLGERVRFRGWMDRAGLARELPGMDLFVFPSRDEGMPNAVLEAMASGLPVAATRIAGNEELVVPGGNGLLCPPDSPVELARTMAWMLGVYDRFSASYPQEATAKAGFPAFAPAGEGEALRARQDMGAASRARVEKDYSWAATAARYLELLGRMAP